MLDDYTPYELLFAVRKSIRYHARRVRFYERLNLIANTVSVIFGSATVFALMKKAGEDWVAACAAVVTAFSAINLIIGSSSMARSHQDLYRRFVQLEKKLIGLDDTTCDHDEFVKLCAERLDIEADEPPALSILNIICHNETAKSLGLDKKEFYVVGFWQRTFAPFFDFFPDKVSKAGS